MQARSTVSVVLSLTLVFAASLAGPLHEMVAHHHCSSGDARAAGSLGHWAHGHAHTGGIACVFESTSDHGDDASESEHPSAPHDCDDDCLICHLLAQALLTSEASVLAVEQFDVRAKAWEFGPVCERDAIRLAHPRGPPAIC